MRRRIGWRVMIAMAAMGCTVTGLDAQQVQVSGRAGVAAPSDAYGRGCGHAYGAYGVDVQTRGRRFLQASLDRFSGAGGGDVACLPGNPAVETVTGGLDLQGANRASLGGGFRVGERLVVLEGAALASIIRGARGHRAPAPNDTRHTLPQLGGRANVILARVVVLSLGADWTRLTRERTPLSGGGTTRTSAWEPMVTMQAGVRIGAR